MVPLSTDELLALALPIFYFASSVLLLDRDEMLLLTGGSAISRIDLGSDFLLAGRRPAMANPFAPLRIAVRGTWTLKELAEADTANVARSLQAVSAALRPVGVLSAIAAACAVVGAPWALLAARPGFFLLFWAVCVLAALVGGIVALRRRSILGLSRAAVLWATLLAAVCIPFAGLLARTFASGIRPRIQLPEFAERNLSGARWERFRREFLGVLRTLRYEADEESEAASRIDRAVRDLQGSAP